jgi:hypothetical protein
VKFESLHRRLGVARKRFETRSSSVAANIEHAGHGVVNIPSEAIAEVVGSSRSAPETGSSMEPSSEHEREITHLMDNKTDHQTRLPLAAVVDIADSLTFTPSKEELQFLVRYFLWWRDRRIVS